MMKSKELTIREIMQTNIPLKHNTLHALCIRRKVKSRKVRNVNNVETYLVDMQSLIKYMQDVLQKRKNKLKAIKLNTERILETERWLKKAKEK